MIISQLATKIRSRRLTLQSYAQSGFTLIELLIVIALIAILSTIIIVTLNPGEILAKGRDSQRFSDMATLNTAMSLYIADQGTGTGAFPTVTVDKLYIGTTGTTAGNFIYDADRTVDNTGWIPINFGAMNGGSPLSVLPVDPKNGTCTSGYTSPTYDPSITTAPANGCFYEFVMNAGKDKYMFLATAIESKYYTTAGSNEYAANDGGKCPQMYEIGTDLTLAWTLSNPDSCTEQAASAGIAP